MFNPSELEGEVDHSFFDSDSDDGIGDGDKRMERASKAEKESLSTHTKRIESAKVDISPRTNKTRINLKRAENDSGSRIKSKERSRVPSLSSVSCVSDKVVGDRGDGNGDSELHKRPNGSFMALLADARDDNDIYTQSGSETEEEALSLNVSKKSKNKPSPKKLLRSRHTRSPSPISTDTSADADSESSYTGSSRRSSLESPTFLRPNKSSPCSGARRTRRGSEGSPDLPNSCTDESEDTVTDVSPLSSSDTSPLQSLDLKQTEVEEGSRKEQQQQQQHLQQEEESVPSSGLSNMHHAPEDSDQDVDDCSLSLESQLGSKLVFHHPGGRNRKNYSFTNDEVRRIDRENQRLLRELSRVSPGPRPRSAVEMKTHVASNSSLIRLSHSALNRQREQQRIERDNLAFLKRLESVKPTPGMRRTEQLADYQRHVRYQGGPSYPICMSTTGKERSSTRTPSAACPRPTRSRTAFTGTDSSSTPVTRTKKLSAPRPAWS